MTMGYFTNSLTAGNVHAIEYRAALVLVEAHYAAWPATVVEEDS